MLETFMQLKINDKQKNWLSTSYWLNVLSNSEELRRPLSDKDLTMVLATQRFWCFGIAALSFIFGRNCPVGAAYCPPQKSLHTRCRIGDVALRLRSVDPHWCSREPMILLGKFPWPFRSRLCHCWTLLKQPGWSRSQVCAAAQLDYWNKTASQK